MKITAIDILIIAGMIVAALLALQGCKQVIVEDTEHGQRCKINTFLMSSEFDNFYYDPNGIFEVGRYKGIPAEVELEYDPLTRSFKIVTKTNATVTAE